jgi:alginate O-acetyltransferase complex protein AlgI
MFPKLFAGPIVRFGEISDRIQDSGGEITNDQRLSGFFRFVIGLAKKVLIANVLGSQVDLLFALPAQDFSTPIAWIAALGYTFQIYFDFSGYSDMAIGLAMIMGFRFPENFNNPYTAGSITEFWRRWHMSLSNWLRDYVFLPRAYASSRRLKKDRYMGLKAEQWIYMEATLVTMLICGVWHGAAWTFIVWGLFQGLIMILERLFLLKFYKKKRYIAVPVTFFLTILGWMMFRAENIHQGLSLIKSLFIFREAVNYTYINPKFYTILAIAALFSFIALAKGMEKWQVKLFSTEHKIGGFMVMTLISILLFVISLATITSTGFNPFIYFRF